MTRTPRLLIDKELLDFSETVALIFKAAKVYAKDAPQESDVSFHEFYDYVRQLPYHADPEEIETLTRPGYTLNPEWEGPRDCDDKCLCLGAYCERNNIKWRIVVSGRGDFAHHVYPEVKENGRWVAADATYPERSTFGKTLFKERFREVFDRK
jgi:hypothetical protein